MNFKSSVLHFYLTYTDSMRQFTFTSAIVILSISILEKKIQKERKTEYNVQGPIKLKRGLARGVIWGILGGGNCLPEGI